MIKSMTPEGYNRIIAVEFAMTDPVTSREYEFAMWPVDWVYKIQPHYYNQQYRFTFHTQNGDVTVRGPLDLRRG